jgi:hypothetical protein
MLAQPNMRVAPERMLAVILVTACTFGSMSSGAQPAPSDAASTSTELLFFVPSSGWIADRTFIAASKINGPSATARQLATALASAERGPVQLTVTGKSEPKTIQVIKDAFEAFQEGDLSNLDFTFIGSSKASAEVAKLVAASKCKYHSRSTLDF